MNLKKIIVLLAATAMLAACNANANNNKSTSEDPASDNPSEVSEDTTSEDVTSEDTTSEDDPSSEDSGSEEEDVDAAFAATLEDVLENAEPKRGILTVPDYIETQYLGPNIVLNAYLGDYASYGQTLYLVNEVGFFPLKRASAEEEFVVDTANVKIPAAGGLYDYYLYSAYDLINDDFPDLLTLDEASEDAFVATIDVTSNATKAYLAYLIGYGVNYGSYVTAATVEIARDATELNFNVTFGGGEELFSITEFGTAANEEIETFVENFEYVPEEPTWPAEDIATLFEDAGFTDELPEYEGEYTVAEAYDFYGYIMVDITCADGETALAAYAGALDEAGFTPLADTAEGNKRFASVNNQYIVELMVIPDGFSLVISEYVDQFEPSDTFPVEDLNKAIEGVGDALPEITGATEYLVNLYSVGYIEFYVTFATAEEAQALYDGYGATLVENSFTESTDDWGDTIYVSPDDAFAVQLYDISGATVEIDIYVV